MMSLSQIRPAWVEVDLDAIGRNIQRFRRLTGDGVSIMAVVKANGYGHGAVEVARASLEAGAGWLGVAMLSEALELRRAKITAPILILGYTPEEQAESVVVHDLTQAVWTPSMAAAMLEAGRNVGKPARMHLKIDTGMSRIGARPGEELASVVRAIKGAGCHQVDGAFTHFPAADTDPAFTEHQFATFMGAIEQIRGQGVFPGILHCCNSAALLLYPRYHLDMVRPGIAVYGYPPVPAEGLDVPLTLRARLSHVKQVSPGATVGYGRTFRATSEMVVGTVPVGYADGYRRQLSNSGEVSAMGVRAPIAGRVCMDQFMVDLSRIPGARAGDEIVLMGGPGPSGEDIAALAGTIVNDVLTGLSPRLPRVYRKASSLYMLDEKGNRVDLCEAPAHRGGKAISTRGNLR
ncbi:MAG: alanine racemase [Ignavibacteriales bacterium]